VSQHKHENDPHYTLSIPREAEVFGLHIHFTDPMFELNRNEYEIGHYNTIQYKKLIAQYNCVIVQLPHTVCNMSITNYHVKNFAYVHNMKTLIYPWS